MGNWTPAELKQLGGRLGRPCELLKNDIIPMSHSLIHITSEWANSVADIGLKRHSPRTVVVPEEVKPLLEQMDYADLDKMYKLIDGGKHIQADLATFYSKMESMSLYEEQVEKWRWYKEGGIQSEEDY